MSENKPGCTPSIFSANGSAPSEQGADADIQERAREIAAGLTLKDKGALAYAQRYGFLPAPQNRGDYLSHDRLGDLGCAHLRVLTNLGRAVAAVLAEGGGK